MKEHKKLIVVFWFLVIFAWTESLSPCKELCATEDGDTANCDCSSHKRLERQTETDDLLHHIMKLPKRSVEDTDTRRTANRSRSEHRHRRGPRHEHRSRGRMPKRLARAENTTAPELFNVTDVEQRSNLQSNRTSNVTVESRLNIFDPNSAVTNITVPVKADEMPKRSVETDIAMNASEIPKITKRSAEDVNTTMLNPTANLTTADNRSLNLENQSSPVSETSVLEAVNAASSTQNKSVIVKREVSSIMDLSSNLTLNEDKISKRDDGNITSNVTEITAKISKREIQNEDLNPAINNTENIGNISKIDDRNVTTDNIAKRGVLIVDLNPAPKTDDANVTSNISEIPVQVTKREVHMEDLNLSSNNTENANISKKNDETAIPYVSEIPSKRDISNEGLGLPANTSVNIANPPANASETIKNMSKREVQNSEMNPTLNNMENLGNFSNAPINASDVTAPVSKREDQNSEVNLPLNDTQPLNASEVTAKVSKREGQNDAQSPALNNTENVGNISNVPISTYDAPERISKREVENSVINSAVNLTENVESIPIIASAPELSRTDIENNATALNYTDNAGKVSKRSVATKQVRFNITDEPGTENGTTLKNVTEQRGIMLEDPLHFSETHFSPKPESMPGKGPPRVTLSPREGKKETASPAPATTGAEAASPKFRRFINDTASSSQNIGNSLTDDIKTQPTESSTTGAEEKKMCCNKASDQHDIDITLPGNTQNCTENHCSAAQTESRKTNLTIIISRLRRDIQSRKPKIKGKRKSVPHKTSRAKRPRRYKPQQRRRMSNNHTKREISNDEKDTFPKHIIELRESNFTVTNFTGPDGNTVESPSGNDNATVDGKIIQKRSDSAEAIEKKSDPQKSGKRTKRSIVDNLSQGNELDKDRVLFVSVIKKGNDSIEKDESELNTAEAPIPRTNMLPSSYEMDVGSTDMNITSDDTPTLIRIDVENKTEDLGLHIPSYQHLPKFLQPNEKEQESSNQVMDDLKKGFIGVGCGCPIYYDRLMGQRVAAPVLQGTLVSLPKGSPDFIKEIMCSTACCQMNSLYSKVQKEIICHGVKEWEKAEKTFLIPHPTELWNADNIVMCSFLSENDESTLEYILSWLRIIVIYIIGILLILVLICLYLTCFLRPYKKLSDAKTMDNMVRLVLNKKSDAKSQGYLISPKV